jgi:hypothetical protein
LTTEQVHAEAVYGWHGSYDGDPYPTAGTIAKNASLTVSHKLLLSMTTSNKMLCSRYAPMDIELTLADPGAWLNTTGSVSQSYSIQNIQLQYNASVLDESIQESFYKALLSNRVLSVPIQQTFQVVQSIPAGSTSYTFSVVRAFSKLTHVCITFRSKDCILGQEFQYPTVLGAALTNAWAAPVFDADTPAPSIRVSLGSKNVPEYEPCQTVQEHFWQLQESLPATPMLDRKKFCTDSFMSVWDLRRTPGDATSAMSTRQGDQLRIDIKNLAPWSSDNSLKGPIECHVTLFAFGCLSIREMGCSVLD